MATPQITPEQQEDIQSFNQLVQQLEAIRMNLQQLELEKRDVDIALKETKDMDPSTVIYRSAGRLLFQTSVEDIKTYLTEEQEKIEVRISSLTNREKKLVTSVKELQEKLMGKKKLPIQLFINYFKSKTKMSSEIEDIGIKALSGEELEEIAFNVEEKILIFIQDHTSGQLLTDYSIIVNLSQTPDKILTLTLDLDIAGGLSSSQLESLQEELFEYGQKILKEELKCLKNS